MTVNQVTHELLTPAEIREIAAYVQRYRECSEAFDIAFNGERPSDPEQASEMIQQYAAAGTTWWVELDRGSFTEYRERIRKGPPRT